MVYTSHFHLFLAFSVNILFFIGKCTCCHVLNGTYDLSSLSGVWPVIDPLHRDQHYDISMCEPLKYEDTACVNSSVCLMSNGTASNLGNYRSELYAVENTRSSGFTVFLVSEEPCGIGEVAGSVITFACGSHLGSPVLTMFNKCRSYFHWETSAACKVPPKLKEVPCYTFDSDGNKIDLSPLIKNDGAYEVVVASRNSVPKPKVLINVCSEILPGHLSGDCSNNTAVCSFPAYGSPVSFGPSTGLQFARGRIFLTYENNHNSSVCEKKIVIMFRCPDRLQSRPPIALSSLHCPLYIEWETEYACPESVLKGDTKTCRFTEDVHGVNIDLSPLRTDTGYNISGFIKGSSQPVQFFLNVCGSLNQPVCNLSQSKYISACMFNPERNSSEIIGAKLGQELHFADSSLTLTYQRPSACEGDTAGATVISFICSSEEMGPQHLWSDNCTHVFEWRTVHACVEHNSDLSCIVKKGEYIIDLGRLSKSEDDSWLVMDERTNKEIDAVYFMDVCKQNVSACQDNAAVCRMDGHGGHLNLGRFTSEPSYNAGSDSVVLKYENGDPCQGNLSWSSTINFRCKPGYLWTSPFITNINTEACHYEFDWHTAEVCPLEFLRGSDCKLYNEDLGLNFDFSSLKSSVYEVETELYKFRIGICEAISCAGSSEQNVSVCQTNKNSKASEGIAVGETSDVLLYENGIIYLSYPHEGRNTSIVFICDHKAGRGNPALAEYENDSLVFYWYTDLMCNQNMAVDCVVHNPKTNELYDLSRLSAKDSNWVTFFEDFGVTKKSYINVCKPLLPQPNCKQGAASCIVDTLNDKELPFVRNAGSAVAAPEIFSDGYIQLRYPNGDPCVAFGKNTSYTTVIHFMCSKNFPQEKGPRFLGRVGACHYTYLWSTSAACPSGEILVKDKCFLTDAETGFTFDLTLLQNNTKPYTVTLGNKTYQLNICGSVKGGCLNEKNKTGANNVSVCEVAEDGHFMSALAVSDSYTLHYSAEAGLQLVYKHNNASFRSEVVIRFPCSNSSVLPQAKLLESDDSRYVFEMKTSLTCQSKPFICNFVDDKGREYDLTPLSQTNRYNWVVSDTREEYAHLRYHISFCQPLNRISTYKCPGGAVSACQISVDGTRNEGISLGTQFGTPTVSEDGVVTVIYSNGAECHNKGIRSSTHINLVCSQTQGSFTFIGETPECEYLFTMNTPAACPLQTSRGSNCSVKEPVFGYTFDLSPLKVVNAVVTAGEFNYSIGVCQSLENVFGKCSGAAACQLKPSDPKFAKSLGLPSSDLVYDRGVVTLKYEHGSGNCHGHYNRSSVIAFTCDHDAPNMGIGQPTFISEAQYCSYLFTWATRYACPPFKSIECSAYDNEGHLYDLSPLSNSHGNYYITIPVQNKTFIINICRSIVHTPVGFLCPYSSAACMVNSREADLGKRAVNIGEAEQGPYFENDSLRLKYTSGQPCNIPGSTAHFMETIIDFSCKKEKVFSEPEYIGHDDCTYYFDWETAYACHHNESISNNDCTVSDPHTGFIFNLTLLKSRSPYQIKNNDHIFHLSVCDSVSNSPCGLSGVCQEEVSGTMRHFNAGKPNGNLKLFNDVLVLNYTNGDSCHNGQFQRSTIIQFHCGKGVGKPTFMFESNDCTYYFSWHTELACQISVHCAATNGTDHFDLSSLSLPSYHLAESDVYSDDSRYYISVCGPLGVIPGVPCDPSSSICRVSRDGNVESLGHIEYSPFMDFTGFVTSIYIGGSACEFLPDEKKRSRIIFECDPDELEGEPVLIEINEEYCLYLFRWRTSVVCPSKPTEEPLLQSCVYKDSGKGIYFDLSSIHKAGSYYEVKGITSEDTFLLNVCGTVNSSKLENCAGSSVCYQNNQTVESYGLASTQELSYDGHRLRLTFTDGDSCPTGTNGRLTSEIFFVCNPDSGIGRPSFYKGFSCLVVFMWETNLVCRNLEHQCSFDVDGDFYDLYLLSSLSHNWNTTDSKDNIYWLNLCRGIQQNEDTLGCPPSAAVCMRDSTGSHMPLGMVHSMKAKKTNSSALLLTYDSHSRQPCLGLQSTLAINATTRIFLTCGRTLGSPELISGPDASCYYDFIWKTSLACPVKTEEIILDESGILFEKDLNYGMDISPILHRTFAVDGITGSDHYTYLINLDGVYRNKSQPGDVCAKAAVCQTKLNQSFKRDIGSADTLKFYKRGSQLHLTMTSLQRSCGKNRNRNVTTVINLECSTSGDSVGMPKFLYESGGCDYIFDWGTYVVCSSFHRPDKKNATTDAGKPDHFQDSSSSSPSHKAGVVIGFLFLACITVYIIFVLSKAERRAAVASKFRVCFSRVTLPQFQYRRWVGEEVSLVGDDLQPKSLHKFTEDENNLL